MARSKGSANLSASLEVLAGAPLDAREKVAIKADLTAEGSFPYSYIGMETYVVAEDKKYRLIGDDPTNIANWEEVGVGSSGASSLSELNDTAISSPSSGQVLSYNGTKWANGAVPSDNTKQPKTLSSPITVDGTEVTTVEDALTAINNKSGSGDSTLTSDVTSNLAVGAIPSGTTLPEGTTFTEFAQKLLVTEIAPTISFSITKSGNVAYGSSYTETLTVNVSAMGTAKKIKSIAWYEGSTLKHTDTVDSTVAGSWSYAMATATTDTTTFKAIVTYTKSNDVDATSEKTASISFYYNKFYGAVNTLTPSEATVEALTSALATGKGGTYKFTVNAGRICYAYPKSLGALTSIKDGNGFSLFDSFTRTEQNYTQNNTSVAYYLYVLTDATTVSAYNVQFS